MSVCNLHALVTKNVVHHGKGFHYGGSGVYGDSAASSIRSANTTLICYLNARFCIVELISFNVDLYSLYKYLQ